MFLIAFSERVNAVGGERKVEREHLVIVVEFSPFMDFGVSYPPFCNINTSYFLWTEYPKLNMLYYLHGAS